MKKALITGITGQDGSYLAEFLIKKKYQVHGIIRRVALEDETHRMWRIRGITNKVKLHPASLESYANAKQGRYVHLILDKRVTGNSLPTMSTISFSEKLVTKLNNSRTKDIQ